MSKNINKAFLDFSNDFVNLDSDRTTIARSSRNWLINQINSIASKEEDFPILYSEENIFFGSFARNTKIRDLDDIDLMICLGADGTTYSDNSRWTSNVEINISDSSTILKGLCHDGSTRVNSTKIINKFKQKLEQISQYLSSEIHKNHEALTLKLKSYEWNFDIVPCFITRESSEGKNYYLIPDGKGYWKKTDPRIDKENLTSTNQKHDGKVLNVIRLIKYWNRTKFIGINSSYLLENMVINYYKQDDITCSKFIDLEFIKVLNYLKEAIKNPVDDPKGIQGNLNQIDILDALIISKKIDIYYNKATEARRLESKDYIVGCFAKWKEVLGNDFPNYE